jgi:RNA polymerase sigma factor (sigma-70 family)
MTETLAMAHLPLTRPSLLLRLKDLRDQEAWADFVAIYAPLVYGFGRQRGLQEADARDLTQEVLRAVATSAERLEYDPERGSFRSWLYTVTRNKYLDLMRGRGQPGRGTGDSDVLARLNEEPAREEDQWEQEYQHQVFAWAGARVRGEFEDSTWQAFWQVAVEGKKAKQAAADLKLTVAAVYIAKSKILARLREEIQPLLDE